MLSMGYRFWLVLGGVVGLLKLSPAGGADAADLPGDVYPTYGVHNAAQMNSWPTGRPAK
jgi:hypothetical protein